MIMSHEALISGRIAVAKRLLASLKQQTPVDLEAVRFRQDELRRLQRMLHQFTHEVDGA